MDHGDPVFIGFTAAINRNLQLAATMGVLGFVPWLRKILPRSWTGENLVIETVNQVNAYFKV